MVWLATLICVNLQTSFLTPPFGWALFFLRGVAPPEITTGDIYRGIVPFVLMQMVALVLCFCVSAACALAAADDRLVAASLPCPMFLMVHLHAGRAASLRADTLDREIDLDLTGRLELQRGFDVVAFFERLLQADKHHMIAARLELDGLPRLDLDALGRSRAFS